jgi:hypothetical protein
MVIFSFQLFKETLEDFMSGVFFISSAMALLGIELWRSESRYDTCIGIPLLQILLIHNQGTIGFFLNIVNIHIYNYLV